MMKWILKKSPLVSYDSQEKENFQREWSDEEGIVETDLKPSGYISINKVKYQAVSNGIYIKKGQKIKVIANRGDTLIVTEV